MKNKKKKDEIAAADAAVMLPANVAGGKRKAKDAIPAQPEKMTIYEYEEKYVKRQNTKSATFFLRLIIALIGVFFVWCFFTLSKSIWEMNEYAGYAAAGVSVILFIIFYIVPVVKILKTDYFVTAVNYKTCL